MIGLKIRRVFFHAPPPSPAWPFTRRFCGRRLLRGEHDRRMLAYHQEANDFDSARRAGISVGAWTDWRRRQGLKPKQVSCACGNRILRPARLHPELCAPCRRALRARERRRWNDQAFREKVRALIGKRVVLHHVVPGEGGRWTRGFLKGFKLADLVVQAKGRYVRIHKFDLMRAAEDLVGSEQTCGCGCGEKFTLTYRPTHPAPFFRSGHKSRLPGANMGRFRKGQAPPNKGLKGEAFWKVMGEHNREKLMKGIREGHRRNKENATYLVHMADGQVGVSTDERQPCGARKVRMRSHLVMEKKLGRRLRREECVIHLNWMMDDDREENLGLVVRSDLPGVRGAKSSGLSGRAILEHVLAVRGQTKRPQYWRDPAYRERLRQRIERRTGRRIVRRQGKVHDRQAPAPMPVRPEPTGPWTPFCPHCKGFRFRGRPHECVARDAPAAQAEVMAT